MNTLKLVSIGAVLLSIVACSHPIEIRGEGDVRSASGTRDCLLEAYRAGSDQCRKNVVVEEYDETYYAEPRTGWEFERWLNYCEEASDNSCHFEIDPGVVRGNWGMAVPPLVAVFKRVLPEVKREILADIRARDSYREVAGLGYAYVCPGPRSSRAFLIDVPGFDPTVVNREPSQAELERICGDQADAPDYHRVYITWHNGADYLQRNAGFVRAALELIADKYALTRDDKVALVATSMGGVVSRYALLQMENEGVDSRVDLFITVDSPHTGAYVPIGIQHIANVFASFGGKATLDVVNTPAARQMLRYHYERGDSAQTFTDDYRSLYLDELEALGGYPRAATMRTVAVASGRGDGVQEQPLAGDRYLDASYQLFSKTYKVNKTFNLLVTKYTFSVSYKVKLVINAEAWALETTPTGDSRVARVDVDASINGISTGDSAALTDYFRGEVSRLTGVSKKLIPTFIVSSIVGIATDKVDEALGIYAAPYENRSFYASNDGRTSAGVPAGLGDAIRLLRIALKSGGFSVAGVTPAETPLNAFIPTASALGVGSADIGVDGFGADLDLTEAEWQAASPFDRIYIDQSKNYPHTESSDTWKNEISALFADTP